MTMNEALTEARKRWGNNAFVVIRGDCMSEPVFTVGYKTTFIEHAQGESLKSFEAAFKYADEYEGKNYV